MTTMAQAIAAAKKDVADGFATSYSTEPGQVWLYSDQGWFKTFDDNEGAHYLGSNDTLADF